MNVEVIHKINELHKKHQMEAVDTIVSRYREIPFEEYQFYEFEDAKRYCWKLILESSADDAEMLVGIVGLAYFHWCRNANECTDFYRYFSHWLEAMSGHVNFQRVDIRLKFNALKNYYPINESLMIRYLHSDWGSVSYAN